MKDKKLSERFSDLIMSRKFGLGFAVVVGGIVTGLTYKIGECIGNYHGIEETSNEWLDAFEKIRKESEDAENNQKETSEN